MPYLVVAGQFHLFYKSKRHVGSRPDGDSMWFRPTNPKQLKSIEKRKVDYNKGGFVQLRFEGIDALELHYNGSNHQKSPECITARDELLKLIGFSKVTYADSDTCDIDTSVQTSTLSTECMVLFTPYKGRKRLNTSGICVTAECFIDDCPQSSKGFG